MVHAVDATHKSNIIVVGGQAARQDHNADGAIRQQRYTPERVRRSLHQQGDHGPGGSPTLPISCHGMPRASEHLEHMDADRCAGRGVSASQISGRVPAGAGSGPAATVGGTDPTDAFGDVFVVSARYDDLYARTPCWGDASSLVARSRIRVHLMCSAGGWIHGQRQACCRMSRRRIQLRLAHDPGEPDGAFVDRIAGGGAADDRPGFGLTEACTGAARSVFQPWPFWCRRAGGIADVGRESPTQPGDQAQSAAAATAGGQCAVSSTGASPGVTSVDRVAIRERHELGPGATSTVRARG